MARDGNIGRRGINPLARRGRRRPSEPQDDGMDKSNGQDESQNNGENLTPNEEFPPSPTRREFPHI